MSVTVLVRGVVVVVRGRDATGAVRLEEEVPLTDMSDAHVELMRERCMPYSTSSPSAPHASQTRPR